MLSCDYSSFDYSSLAELYPQKGRLSKRQYPAYKRFDTAAEAIRYAVEDLDPDLLVGAILEVDEQRFDGEAIKDLYASVGYPLPRAKRRSV